MNIINWVENGFERLSGKYKPGLFYPVLLGILITLGFSVLLIPGIPDGHDLYYHLSRLQAMVDGARNGVFPVMLNHSAMNGYGYASGLFYPDIFLNIIVLLSLCGIKLIAAYKIFLFIWGLFTAYSAYYAGKRISGNAFAGFACGLLYMWSSYAAVDFFTRSALGEILAFPFFPWVMLGLFETIYRNKWRFYYLIIGFGGIILSHNLSCLLAALAAAAIGGFNVVRLLREPSRIFLIALAGLCTAGIAGFYLITLGEQMLTEKFIVNTIGTNYDVPGHVVPFTRLFLELPYMKMAYWFPPGIGIILIICLLQRLRFQDNGNVSGKFRDVMLMGGVVCLLCATSFLPWEGAASKLGVLQFPWRFYLPATCMLALGGGLTVSVLAKSNNAALRRWLYILLFGCSAAYFINVGYTYAAKIHEKNMIYGFTSGKIQEVSGVGYIPAGTDMEKLFDRNPLQVLAEPQVALTCSRPTVQTVAVNLPQGGNGNILELPLTYYSGYAVQYLADDGQKFMLPVQKGEHKLVQITLPENCPPGTLTAFYQGTLLQTRSRYLSLTALVFSLLLSYAAYRMAKRYDAEHRPSKPRYKAPRRNFKRQTSR